MSVCRPAVQGQNGWIAVPQLVCYSPSREPKRNTEIFKKGARRWGKESLQKKIGRARPPRVHITYDAETGGAIEKGDLPFVVGVFADLSGQTVSQPLPMSQR